MALDDMNEGFLQVTNHKEHPTNKAYKVFFFYSEEESSFFETQLTILIFPLFSVIMISLLLINDDPQGSFSSTILVNI